MIKKNDYGWHSSRIATGITILILLLTGVAFAGSSSTGNRIWEKNMNTTYTWDAYSFSGFYYNLDSNLGTEELTIGNIDRNIGEGDISYTTSPADVSFDHSGFGKYQVIGFMADKYFAGYTSKSNISNREVKSTLGSKQLHKILLDDDTKRTVSEGGTLTLQEGYVLKIKEVDIGAGPGQVWITLLKDGNEIDSDTISGQDTYVYSKRVGTESDMPIIAVHFDSVFRGREVNAAFIKGVFQISESFIQVRTGDKYGVMEIRRADENGIEMKNENSIDLSRGNTVDLMGDLKIKVADSDTLRFALAVEKTGTFEVRGTIYPNTSEWTPLNFGINAGGTNIGFYYNMDENIGKERLKIESSIKSSRSIPENELNYSTSPEEVSFDYSGFGKYQVIGFMADKYFAGYTSKSNISNREVKSTLGSKQLHKILLDDDTKRTVSEGGTLTLQEGYVLKIKEVDIGAGPGQVWITLLKDGNEIDSDTISGQDNYVYSKKVGTESDMPIIAVHFDSVFRGREVNAAFIKGVFQISESFIQVRTGDKYGEMEIRRADGDGIEMRNENSIELSRGSTVDLMGNIKFRVADSGSTRFYPFVKVVPEMVANQLLVDTPNRATAGDNITIKVTAGGKAVEGASIVVDSEAGQTGADGILNYTLQKTMKGMYNITATKLGYQKTSKAIEVQEYTENTLNTLSIQAPAKVNQFETIEIQVLYNDTAISDAAVVFDNTTIGQTDSNGTLRYALNVSGVHNIYASKDGYTTAARGIEVLVPFADYRALDINLIPSYISTDQKIAIRSNITNAGTKADNLSVVLIINSTEVNTTSVALAPGETKEIDFEQEMVLPAGNYTVEILGQKRLLEIRDSPFNVFLAVGVIIVLGAIIIYLVTAKRMTAKRMTAKRMTAKRMTAKRR